MATSKSVLMPLVPKVADSSAGRPWWLMPLALYALSRVVDTTLLLVLGAHQVAHLPYSATGIPLATEPPSFEHLLMNWDGQWYAHIAEHGYPHRLPLDHGAVAQNPWAFYPLLPGLARLVMLFGLPFGWAASVIATSAGAGAACVLARMVRRHGSDFGSSLAVLGLFFAPAALLFQTAYADSVALLIVLLALDALGRRRYATTAAWTLLLAVTRPIALPLAAVVAVHVAVRWHRKDIEPFPRSERRRATLAVIACVGSFAVWPGIAALRTGRLDAYLATQSAWNAMLSDGATWVQRAVEQHTLTAAVVLLTPVALLTAMAVRRGGACWGLELRAWTVVYPLYILCVTAPRPSVFRHLLLAVCPWWPAPDAGAYVTSRTGRVLLASSVVLVGTGLQFLWIRSCYVISPHSAGYP